MKKAKTFKLYRYTFIKDIPANLLIKFAPNYYIEIDYFDQDRVEMFIWNYNDVAKRIRKI